MRPAGMKNEDLMSLYTVLLVVSAVAAGTSGVFWILAARITVPVLHGYLSRPPRMVQANAKAQSRYNAAAAWCAGVAAICQCASTAITIHGLPMP